MSEETRITGGVLFFDLRQGRTADDVAIERLVKGLLEKGFKQAQLRNLQWSDVCSAFLECAARAIAAPQVIDPDHTVDGDFEAFASEMAENLRVRIVDNAKCLPPGADEIGETRGSA